MTTNWIERIPEKFKPPPKFLIPLLFILNVALVFPIFFPNLSDIGSWDESFYINSGRGVVDGKLLQQFAWNPLLSFLYALVYIPVKFTTFWLIHSCTIGRFILFGLMWLSAYLVSKQLSHVSHPFIMIALLLLSPALTYLLPNPSDALFTALSAFALWQVLSFYNERKIKHVWLASLFVGLSALSRNDGLILFVIFVTLVIFLSIPIKRIVVMLIAGIVPFAIVVSSYLTLYRLESGVFKLGIAERSYIAFEQGQSFVYEKNMGDGQIEARRLFGTPEENQYSFLSAIKRNPEAFFDRVRQTIKTSPKKIYFMYGERTGIIILMLAAMGAIEIARKRLYLLFLILLLWPAYIFVYLLTFYRHTYFLLPYFVVFVFASVSLNFILYHMNKRRLYCWTILLLGLAVLGTMTNRPNVFSAVVIFLIGLWIIKNVVNRYQDHEALKPVAIILALCCLFILKVSYPYPKFRTLGVAPDERAVLFMKEHLEPGSVVFAEAPGPIWVGKMHFRPLDFNFRNLNEQDIFSLITSRRGKAVYVNNALRYFEPGVVEKIEKMIGKKFEIGFRSENGEVEVLLVTKRQ
ncbi:MAG: hypothetical protein NT096_03525 [Proteobacteria bacterium]|nr:hypothetical protein [Pseudomonadota bacterium]